MAKQIEDPARVDPARTTSRLDSDTLEAVRRREPEALATLFETHFDRLYNVAFRLVGEHARTEDVLQEVFLKVHRAADQLDASRDPGPWLVTLTRNACREQWRRRGRGADGRATSLEDAPALHEPPRARGEDPEDGALRAERERAVAGALMALSGGLREVVVLHDYLGMAHEEIASVVGARASTVRKRYSRALAELRQRLRGVIG